jgi:DNA-3-methyladenine glycosylase I
MNYCEFVATKGQNTVHQHYHDQEYGFPLQSDAELFERLILEINQAGLSWETILKKRASFRRAYNDFNIATIANYEDSDRQRLMQDEGIIRNRLKVDAAIFNARRILEIQAEYGSFAAWLQTYYPREKAEWVTLFKKNFKFVGGEIVGEFLMSIGLLPGAHVPDCPVSLRLAAIKSPSRSG